MEQTELEKQITQINLLNETVEQIKKDFDEAGLTVLFSGKKETAYSELCSQMRPFIEKLLSQNYSHLMQVLYRIDVPENLVKSSAVNDKKEFAEQLTGLIIKRELQKVVMRNLYKQNPL